MKHHYSVSTDHSKLDFERIHDFISNRSYWAKGRSLATMQAAIDGSTCFGLYEDNEQVGFARVISDKVVLAYLLDFFILETHRGQGLSRVLMESILAHEDFQTTFWLLSTGDAHELYAKFGFKRIEGASRLMRRPANSAPS